MKLALAGSGFIAGVHAAAAHANGISLMFVASREPSKQTTRAGRWGARACRYEDLPSGADAVVVATPPFRHCDDTLKILESGAAAIVEKPLCTTLADADRIMASAEAHGNRLGYAENWLFSPVVEELNRQLPSIGNIKRVRISMPYAQPRWGDYLTPRYGGGALFDSGAHALAIALFLLDGDIPISVRCSMEGGPIHEMDEHGEAEVAFASGATVLVSASWRATVDGPWEVNIKGSVATLYARLLPSPNVRIDGAPLSLPAPRTAAGQLEEYGFVDQLRAFTDDFTSGRAPRVGAAFGRSVLDILCAAYSSAAANGSSVTLPFIGPRDKTPLELWRS